jgi:hypothetical protein
MTATYPSQFGSVFVRRLVGCVRLHRSRDRRLKGQHALLDDGHALLAAPPEQAVRQQQDSLPERRVLFGEPLDLAAEFVEDCLGLCTARHHTTTTASVSKHRRPRCRDGRAVRHKFYRAALLGRS